MQQMSHAELHPLLRSDRLGTGEHRSTLWRTVDHTVWWLCSSVTEQRTQPPTEAAGFNAKLLKLVPQRGIVDLCGYLWITKAGQRNQQMGGSNLTVAGRYGFLGS